MAPVWFSTIIPIAVEQPTLMLAAIVFFDALFGVVPVEILVALGIVLGFSAVELALMCSAIFVVGALIDYAVGFFGAKILPIREEDMQRGRGFFEKYGGLAILAVRIMPVPAKPLSIIAGWTRYSISLFALLVGIGSFSRIYLEASLLVRYGAGIKRGFDALLLLAQNSLRDPARHGVVLVSTIFGILAFYVFFVRRRR